VDVSIFRVFLPSFRLIDSDRIQLGLAARDGAASILSDDHTVRCGSLMSPARHAGGHDVIVAFTPCPRGGIRHLSQAFTYSD
jgi:hypothetical protein